MLAKTALEIDILIDERIANLRCCFEEFVLEYLSLDFKLVNVICEHCFSELWTRLH